MFRTFIATAFTLLIGGVGLWWQTDGLRAFTLESARRLSVEQTPIALAETDLEISEGGIANWRDWQSQYLIVDFVYTRCGTTCNTLGHEFRRIQKEAGDLIDTGKLTLLSVSFDPDRDGPEQLNAYIRRYSPDTHSWKAARANAIDTAQMLDEFGVIVIPDGWGGYLHNAAMHLIAPGGKLIKIVDYQNYATLLEIIRDCEADPLSKCREPIA